MSRYSLSSPMDTGGDGVLARSFPWVSQVGEWLFGERADRAQSAREDKDREWDRERYEKDMALLLEERDYQRARHEEWRLMEGARFKMMAGQHEGWFKTASDATRPIRDIGSMLAAKQTGTKWTPAKDTYTVA
jgi:hypothetical protein